MTIGPYNVLAFSGERPPERSEEGRSSAAIPCYPATREHSRKACSHHLTSSRENEPKIQSSPHVSAMFVLPPVVVGVLCGVVRCGRREILQRSSNFAGPSVRRFLCREDSI